VRSVVQFWTNTALSFANGVENLSVWMLLEKSGDVRNPIPITLEPITVGHVWTTSSFARGAVSTKPEGDVLVSRVISVRIVKENVEGLSCPD